jgi:hypothetical protein
LPWLERLPAKVSRGFCLSQASVVLWAIARTHAEVRGLLSTCDIWEVSEIGNF